LLVYTIDEFNTKIGYHNEKPFIPEIMTVAGQDH